MSEEEDVCHYSLMGKDILTIHSMLTMFSQGGETYYIQVTMCFAKRQQMLLSNLCQTPVSGVLTNSS